MTFRSSEMGAMGTGPVGRGARGDSGGGAEAVAWCLAWAKVAVAVGGWALLMGVVGWR